jgi:hypothetical protein
MPVLLLRACGRFTALAGLPTLRSVSGAVELYAKNALSTIPVTLLAVAHRLIRDSDRYLRNSPAPTARATITKSRTIARANVRGQIFMVCLLDRCSAVEACFSIRCGKERCVSNRADSPKPIGNCKDARSNLADQLLPPQLSETTAKGRASIVALDVHCEPIDVDRDFFAIELGGRTDEAVKGAAGVL